MNQKKPEDPERFFSSREWKALWVLRPGEWRQEWSTEPLSTKVLAAILVTLLGLGLFGLVRGNMEVGWMLVGLVAIVPSVIAIGLLAHVFAATTRWTLRRTGLLPVWLRMRSNVLAMGRVIIWLGISALIVAALWPYLSLDPIKSWYALDYEVPVERIEVDKKPHDCEFMTAPIGDKHCHYDAQVTVLKGSETSDGQKSLLVSYEKVED